MTTYYSFAPPPNNAFSFQPTLDGQTANAVVWWNTDGQRWYVSVNVQGLGSLFNLPVIGSAPVVSIQSIDWANGTAIVTTDDPHGFPFLATVDVTIAGVQPAAYNGRQRSFIINPNQVIYPLPTNPGAAQALGTVSYDINIGAGYLQRSTLIFREATQMFEVSP